MLWDWKTGRVPNPAYFDDFILQKAQLGIYAIWMKYKFNLNNIRATAVFLRDKDDVAILSEVFTFKVEQDVLRLLKKRRSRLNSLASYHPVATNLCDWCGWKPVCPAFH